MDDLTKNEKNQRRAEVEKRYQLKGRIGEGTYGVVYIARRLRPVSGEVSGGELYSDYGVGATVDPAAPVAVKRFKLSRESEGIAVAAVREIALLRELEHPNIVNLEDVFVSVSPEGRSLSLVIDYADHDLFGILRYHRKQNVRVPVSIAKSIMWQLFNGIAYLHSNWVVHRDLKPSNILVMGKSAPSNSEGVVKITDFGLARIFQSPLRPLAADGLVVTLWADGDIDALPSSVQLLGARHYSRPVDIWAAGCILAELFSSSPLFRGQEDNTVPAFQYSQLLAIFKVLGTPTLDIWPRIKELQFYPRIVEWTTYPNMLRSIFRSADKNVLDLLAKTLAYDPAKRISAAAALEHPWFKTAPYPTLNVFQYGGHEVHYPDRKVIPI